MLRIAQKYYSGGKEYQDTVGYSNTATTDASGNAVYYLTDNGTSSGKAIFSQVFMESLTFTPLSTSVILLNSGATVSADLKTMTVAVRQNTSLLGLGLIPFSSAQAGNVCLATIRGIAA